MVEREQDEAPPRRGWFDRLDLVKAGMIEMLLGLLLSGLGVVLHKAEYEWPSSFFSHVGVGFMAAGLLTATVEALSHRRNLQHLILTQRRNREHLRQLQKATAYTMLRSFIPKAVFLEVENQIIAKPFTRSGFRLEIKLEWQDAGHTRLRRRATVSYRVRNASTAPQVFKLRAVEDWEEGDPPRMVDITAVYVRRKADAGRRENLAAGPDRKKLEKTQLMVAEDLTLKPGEAVQVVWKSLRLHPNRYSGPLLFNHATRGLVLDVDHPADLNVSLQLHHPDAEAVQVDVDDPDHHVWRFDGGFLPFQGMTLSWAPVRDEGAALVHGEQEKKLKVDRIARPDRASEEILNPS